MLESFAAGFGVLIGYFIVCATAALVFRRFVPMHKEVFRKTLHLILLGSLPIFLYAFSNWWMAVFASLLFVVLVFPILAVAERINGYSELLTERKGGEIKNSLVIVFGMYAVIIAVCWGLLGQQWLALACVYAWGFGDAAAALVGKKYGRHFLEGKTIEGRKSVEGTLAMFVVSFISVLLILLVFADLVPVGYLVIPVLVAAASALVELYTPNGYDTLTCPLTAALIILPLVNVLGA
ncbi:MAG: hypothetical protein QM705_05865 [Ancrocorticia sp.]